MDSPGYVCCRNIAGRRCASINLHFPYLSSSLRAIKLPAAENILLSTNKDLTLEKYCGSSPMIIGSCTIGPRPLEERVFLPLANLSSTERSDHLQELCSQTFYSITPFVSVNTTSSTIIDTRSAPCAFIRSTFRALALLQYFQTHITHRHFVTLREPRCLLG